MCGIGGLVSSKREAPQSQARGTLEKMVSQLSHRGPDGNGIEIFSSGGFAHTRLAIVDLDPRSNQPFWNENRSVCLSFNGEIYNYEILREQLIQSGVQFRTQGDTEVIIKLYEHYGISFVSRLNGIFAFALWDQRTNSTYLVRDPMGVKPLFYSIVDSTLIFASEAKAVLCDDRVSIEADQTQLNTFFTFGYVESPHSGLRDIKQIQPGTYGKFDDGALSQIRYWNWSFENHQEMDFSETLKEFEEIFSQTVKSQLVSDVPLVSFLSGGVDSTAIALALASTGRRDVSLMAFAFSDKLHDESEQAKVTAERLNMPISVVQESSDFNDLPRLISRHAEDPFADSSSIAMFALARATSRKYKVALSGDGGDELLAGYSTYNATAYSNRLHSFKVSRALKYLLPLTRMVPKTDKPYSAYQKLFRFVSGGQHAFPFNHAHWRTILSSEFKKKVYSDGFFESLGQGLDQPYVEYVKASSQVLNSEKMDWVNRCLSMDLFFYLINDMLVKVDRMSMASGLEVRVPFLDPNLVQYCLSLPASFKLKSSRLRFENKYLLKKMLQGRVPDQVITGSKKGFVVPIAHYLRGSWGDQLGDFLQTHSGELSQFLNVNEVKSQLMSFRSGRSDIRFELFNILMFCYWIENRKNRFQR